MSVTTLERPLAPVHGGGDVGKLLAAQGWRNAHLGPAQGWPQALKMALNLVLNARYPMLLAWGPELITFYNDAYAVTLAGAHPGVLGLPLREVWSHVWNDARVSVEQALAGEHVWAEDAPLLTARSGFTQVAYFTFSMSPVPDETGAIMGVLCTSNETTDKVRAQKALRREEASRRSREERLYAVLENAPGFMALVSGPDHVFTMANAAYRRFVARDTLVGRTVAEAIPETVDQGFIALLDRVYETGEAVVGRGAPFKLSPDDGPSETRYGDFIYQPMKDAAGVVKGVFCQGQDVTEQMLAQEALRRRQEDLQSALDANRTIFEHSLDVICTIDAEGVFQQVSRRSWEILGYFADEMVGRSMKDFVHPDDVERTADVSYEILSGKPVHNLENRYIRKDGSVVTVLWSAAWSQEHQLFFAVGRDLTQRIKAEEQLRQAQKMEAVGQLTGGVAHDFNNLLQVIMGNAEMLLRPDVGADASRAFASMIMEAAERGADLTQHLLSFGRRQALKSAPLRLGDVVSGMRPLLLRTLGEHIELRTEADDTPLSALTDRGLLEAAVLNLAVNARDAMPQDGVLTIRTGQRAAEAGEGKLAVGQDVVFLTVEDTGVGIPPDVLEHIFEPFFTTKDIGKGSGLGLSMVYGFADQSGGCLSVQSTVGEGTCFTLVLPAVISHLVPAEDAHAANPSTPGGSERILVVEDEAPVLQLITAQLISLGYRVTSAANGPDALAILRSGGAFDLLLTDVVLPGGISGGDVARLGRTWQPGLKVVQTSGYSEEIFSQHGRLDAATPLLRKPYKRAEVAQLLREVLDAA